MNAEGYRRFVLEAAQAGKLLLGDEPTMDAATTAEALKLFEGRDVRVSVAWGRADIAGTLIALEPLKEDGAPHMYEFAVVPTAAEEYPPRVRFSANATGCWIAGPIHGLREDLRVVHSVAVDFNTPREILVSAAFDEDDAVRSGVIVDAEAESRLRAEIDRLPYASGDRERRSASGSGS